MKHARAVKDRPVISWRRAGLLDVPMIFELMQSGAEAGAFSDKFVCLTGSVGLLGFVLGGVGRQCLRLRGTPIASEWLAIDMASGESAGFLKVTRTTSGVWALDLLAVHPAYRNQGIGTAVLARLAEQLPGGTRLLVYCTKYARAMQHIVKRMHLKRNVRLGIPDLEEFVSEPARAAPLHSPG